MGDADRVFREGSTTDSARGFSKRQIGFVRTDSFDDAGDVEALYLLPWAPPPGLRTNEEEPTHQDIVRWIERRPAHSHEHLIAPDRRTSDLLDLEGLRTSVTVLHNHPHRAPPSVRGAIKISARNRNDLEVVASQHLVAEAGSVGGGTGRLSMLGNLLFRGGVRVAGEHTMRVMARYLLVCIVGAGALGIGTGGSACSDSLGATDAHGALSSAPVRPVARRSPAGRIALSAGDHPHEDIYVVNADGSGLRRLTNDPDADFDPSWSPDGRWIAYRHESGGDETAEIYVMRADGSRQRNLTRRRGQDHSPAWSPDGRRIAFASVRGGPMPTIWVMNADGSHQRRVSPVAGEYPAWSPDGRRLAFDRNTFGPTRWDIWVVNVDGLGAKPVVAWPGDEKGAAWSPDGKSIAFGSDLGVSSGFDRIWLIHPDGSEPRRLTMRTGERPAWSPDSAHVLFTGGGLFVVRRDGSRTTMLPVRLLGEPTLADWSR